MQVKLTVEFDSAAARGMTESEQWEWVDAVTDLINTEAYVSEVQMLGEV